MAVASRDGEIGGRYSSPNIQGKATKNEAYDVKRVDTGAHLPMLWFL